MPTDFLKSKLSDGRLYQWKIAADGKWEEAREINHLGDKEEIRQLVDWAAAVSENIAFEPFFKNPDGTFFFFGVRITELDAATKRKCLNEILRASPAGALFEDVLNKTRVALGAADLMVGRPDFMEVGAQGFWRSYGYYKIWDRVSKTSVATIGEIAAQAPQILRPFKTSMMLEYAWAEPFPSWVAVQISRKSGELFEFSPEIYSELVKPTA